MKLRNDEKVKKISVVMKIFLASVFVRLYGYQFPLYAIIPNIIYIIPNI